MDRPLLLAVLLCLVTSGCYASHTRSPDGGAHADAFTSDARVDGTVVPVCDTFDPTFRCQPNTLYATLLRQTDVEGTPSNACLCATTGCTAGNGCTTQYLPGDDEHLVCSEHVPVLVIEGGVCIRPCSASADCPAGMACLSLLELFGETFVIDQACFYVSPVAP